LGTSTRANEAGGAREASEVNEIVDRRVEAAVDAYTYKN